MNKFELMAANIERAFFDVSKIQARVWDVKVTPNVIRFRFTVGSGVKERAVTGLDGEMAYNLGLPTVRIVREGGQYFLEAPRDTPRKLLLTDLLRQLARVPANTGLLGMQTDAAPLLLRIDSPDAPHALLAGTTGSGKTALLRTLLVSLVLYNQPGHLQLALIDPKGRGLAPFAPLPHIWRRYGVISQPDDAETLLAELTAEMERRDQAGRSLPRIVVAIDELADLLDTNKAVGEQVQRLTQRGREAGLHVVVATQRPTAALVGSMLKANLPARLVGKVTSPEEAKIATGLKETGAEKLQGRGDFLCIAVGQQIRFQAAYADVTTLDGLVALAASRQAQAEENRRRRAWTNLPRELPAKVSASEPRELPARVSAPADQGQQAPALPAPGQSTVTGGAGDNRLLTVTNRPADAPDGPAADESARAEEQLLTVTNGYRRLPWREPTADDVSYLRALYSATGSKSRVCAIAYGGKNRASWEWVTAALAPSCEINRSAIEGQHA